MDALLLLICALGMLALSFRGWRYRAPVVGPGEERFAVWHPDQNSSLRPWILVGAAVIAAVVLILPSGPLVTRAVFALAVLAFGAIFWSFLTRANRGFSADVGPKGIWLRDGAGDRLFEWAKIESVLPVTLEVGPPWVQIKFHKRTPLDWIGDSIEFRVIDREGYLTQARSQLDTFRSEHGVSSLTRLESE
jgi:hypothetical protein